MSDLAATNCGCNCGCENNNNCGLGFANGGGCSCILWILILSCLCGGNGNNLWGNGCGGDSCWLLILILLFCGGGCGNGNGGGCSCGCTCGRKQHLRMLRITRHKESPFPGLFFMHFSNSSLSDGLLSFPDIFLILFFFPVLSVCQECSILFCRKLQAFPFHTVFIYLIKCISFPNQHFSASCFYSPLSAYAYGKAVVIEFFPLA